MEATINAGVKVDFANRAEVRAEMDAALAAWSTEIRRGVRFRRFIGNVAQGATWSIAPDGRDSIGPDEGFVWSVTRVALGGAITFGTDVWSIFVNEAGPSGLITSSTARRELFDVGVNVLNGGDRLIVAGASTAVGAQINITGSAIELPEQLAWQLLG